MKVQTAIVAIAVLIAAFGIAGFLVYDVYQDRQNTVVCNGPVPVYADWEPYPTKAQKPSYVLPAQAILKVKRIRYGKDYMAVRVETQKGESGWIFSGFSFAMKKEPHNRGMLPAGQKATSG